jgi:FKBP-type peptidyl-prolyl cis-trans isomerase (trigger factor)
LETTSKKLDDGRLEITVSLTADEVQEEIDTAYKQVGKNRIPGFRPGKAPRKILENHFGGKEYFLATASDELVRIYTPLAPDELYLVPLSSPDFAELDLAREGEPFSFSFSIEVAPELELSSYEPLQIELPSVEPTDEEMQAQIDVLLAYNTTTDEEGNEQKPELTDAWVKETLEFENVDDFKERVADSLREQKGRDIPQLREIRSTQELASRLVGEVPDSLIRQTEQDNYRDFFQSLQQQRTTMDAYLETYGYSSEDFRGIMHEQARQSAAMALALDALARHLELVATEEDILEEFANSGAKDPQTLYENWRSNGRLSEIRQGIARMKAYQHILDTVEVFEPGMLHPVTEDEPVPDTKEKKASAKATTKSSAKTSKKASAKASKDASAKASTKESTKTPVKADDTKTGTKKSSAKTSRKADDTKKSTSSPSKSAKVDSKKRKVQS